MLSTINYEVVTFRETAELSDLVHTHCKSTSLSHIDLCERHIYSHSHTHTHNRVTAFVYDNSGRLVLIQRLFIWCWQQ